MLKDLKTKLEALPNGIENPCHKEAKESQEESQFPLSSAPSAFDQCLGLQRKT